MFVSLCRCRAAVWWVGTEVREAMIVGFSRFDVWYVCLWWWRRWRSVLPSHNVKRGKDFVPLGYENFNNQDGTVRTLDKLIRSVVIFWKRRMVFRCADETGVERNVRRREWRAMFRFRRDVILRVMRTWSELALKGWGRAGGLDILNQSLCNKEFD